MRRYFLSLTTICLTLFATASNGTEERARLEDYLVGPVRHLFTPYREFTSSDILLRTREPGEQSRVINLSEKRGKVLMVTFWRPCSICNHHLSQLQDLQQEIGKDRLEVVAINAAYGAPFHYIARELERLGFDDITPFQARDRQLYRDMFRRIAHDRNGEFLITWIIDQHGEARFQTDFTMSWIRHHEVMAVLEALLDGEI